MIERYDTVLDLTSCPECGAVAEVLWRSTLHSTDGPIEHARIVCLHRHQFFLPVSMLAEAPVR